MSVEEKDEIGGVVEGLYKGRWKLKVVENYFNSLGDVGALSGHEAKDFGSFACGVATICSEVIASILEATELLQSLQNEPKKSAEV